MSVRTMTVRTLEGTEFVIACDSNADNCWRCEFPHYFDVEHYAKYADETTTSRASGATIFRSGSLHRIFDAIADYVGRSET